MKHATEDSSMFAQPEDLSVLRRDGVRPFEELLYDLVMAEASHHGIPLIAARSRSKASRFPGVTTTRR